MKFNILLILLFFQILLSCKEVEIKKVFDKYSCLNNDILYSDGRNKFILIKGNEKKILLWEWKWTFDLSIGYNYLKYEGDGEEFSCNDILPSTN
jgi:hypothetical protein